LNYTQGQAIREPLHNLQCRGRWAAVDGNDFDVLDRLASESFKGCTNPFSAVVQWHDDSQERPLAL
jgi:hypothetical protein